MTVRPFLWTTTLLLAGSCVGAGSPAVEPLGQFAASDVPRAPAASVVHALAFARTAYQTEVAAPGDAYPDRLAAIQLKHRSYQDYEGLAIANVAYGLLIEWAWHELERRPDRARLDDMTARIEAARFTAGDLARLAVGTPVELDDNRATSTDDVVLDEVTTLVLESHGYNDGIVSATFAHLNRFGLDGVVSDLATERNDVSLLVEILRNEHRARVQLLGTAEFLRRGGVPELVTDTVYFREVMPIDESTQYAFRPLGGARFFTAWDLRAVFPVSVKGKTETAELRAWMDHIVREPTDTGAEAYDGRHDGPAPENASGVDATEPDHRDDGQAGR